MMRLQGAIDNEIHIATQRFLRDGIAPDVDSLYAAIQKSNSSLKRKPKKLLQSSLERVLDFIDANEHDRADSEAEIEKTQLRSNIDPDIMNKSLRAHLTPQDAPSSPAISGDDGQKKRRMPNGEPLSKRQKPDRAPVTAPSDVSLEDVGGLDDVIETMAELLVRPLKFPEKYIKMKAKPPKGILLHGPPGCGKTMLTRAFTAEMQVPFIEILGPSIVSGMSGESEKAVREKFEEAKKNSPCVIFLDEIDAIAPKRESSQSQMEKRIVAQLLTCMDELNRDPNKPVIVIAATNRPDSLDPALRRAGRFDSEINIGVPNERVRERILRTLTRETPLSIDVDFKKLAKLTAGFVGADLADLVAKAVSWQLDTFFQAVQKQRPESGETMDIDGPSERPSLAVLRTRYLIMRGNDKSIPEPPGFENDQVSMQAFEITLPKITPSSKREGFATIPNVSWSDVGALKPVREELQIAVVEPIKHPERYEALGVNAPSGVLLWGPPGCGKTLLAKAAAAESKANFISVKGPELLNKFVGESEAAVRRVFTRARSSVPCVIFFDELDALVPRRDDSGSEASARVVNTLLTELDGMDTRAGIYVIGATNRPDMIDEAMLRPGRFETPLFVDLPGPNERSEILTTLIRDKPVDNMAEIVEVARSESCNGYSGADLGALMREAGHCAIRRHGDRIETQDFRMASKSIRGSVGNVSKYHKLKEKFGHR